MLYSSEVKNILIIGADARDSATRGLSDSMILLSVNKKNKKLQMTSFMRDMYVEIEGYGSDKLNAAYSYGGAELLENTIEDNFKLLTLTTFQLSLSKEINKISQILGN